MQRKIMLVLIFALFIAIFAINNSNPVTIKLFTLEYEVSLVIIVLGAIAFGVLLMGIFSSINQLKLKKELGKYKKQVGELREDNKKLLEEKENVNIEINNQEKDSEEFNG